MVREVVRREAGEDAAWIKPVIFFPQKPQEKKIGPLLAETGRLKAARRQSLRWPSAYLRLQRTLCRELQFDDDGTLASQCLSSPVTCIR